MRSALLDIDRHKCGQTSRPVVGANVQTCCYFKARSWCYFYLLLFFWIIAVCIFLSHFVLGLPLNCGSSFPCCFSYTKICLKLRHHQCHVLSHSHRGQPNEGGIPLNIARYKKTVSSIAWVQLALVICYLPFIIFLPVTTYLEVWPGVGVFIDFEFSVTLVYFNSSLNPILYCWKIKEVRQVVEDTVKNVCCLSS